MTPLTAPADAAKRARVPLPTVQLPPALDWQPEYQGQYLCSEWAKPGALKLSALLRRTYGQYITYISRSCGTPGISEHEEGRAIDWMVDSEQPATRAKARAFLNWLTAPGPNGEPGAMARRLGVMYLIYEDRMWRAYRPQDGWREYNGCFSSQSESTDTSCHRDHIHISLSWDGAYAKTSFWTGTAETRPPCASSAARRPNGSPSQPSILVDTDSGKGVAGKHCRLGAGTSYFSRTYSIRVPVPTMPNGEQPVQRVQLQAFDLNAPVGVTISSAKKITIPQGTKPGGVFEIPLARDGVIRISVGAGYSQLALRGLGTGAPNTAPAAVELPEAAAEWLVNLPLTVTGKVTNPPFGAKVKLVRRTPGGEFRKVAAQPAIGDRYEFAAPPVPDPGTYEYQVVLRQSGTTIARSATRTVIVKPAVIALTPPAAARVAETAVFAGGVLGAPETGAKLLLQAKLPGQAWRTVAERTGRNGGYLIRKRFQGASTQGIRTVLVSGERVWATSPVRTIVIKAAAK